MKRESRSLRIAIALVLPCVAIVAAHAFFDPMYRTNDDPGMLLLAAGQVYVDEPSSYLMFSNHVLGVTLAGLYRVAPDVPWYRLIQLAIQWLATSTLVYLALGRRVDLWRLFPIASCLLVYDMLALVRPHFTLTASAAAAAAVLLGSRLSSRRRWAWFVALWILAALTRHESAVMLFLLSLPPALGRFALDWKAGSREALRRVGIPILVAGAIIASLHGYNRWRYAIPEWRDFNETASGIGAVLDFNAAGGAEGQTWERFPDGVQRLVEVRYSPESYAAAAAGPGWTENDLEMLLSWFYADEALFNPETLSSFLEQLDRPDRKSTGILRPLARDPNLWVLLAAIAVPVAFFRWDRKRVVPLLFAAAGALGLLLFLDLYLNRLLSWVYEPVLMFVCWSATMGAASRLAEPGRRIRLLPGAIAVGLLLSLLPGTVGEISRHNGRLRARADALQDAVQRLDPEPTELYVSWGSAFPLELVGPFEELGPYEDLRFYSVGADTRGAHSLARLRQFGIDDIHEAIYRDPNVRVISHVWQNRVLARYVLQHHDLEIAATLVGTYGQGRTPLFEVHRFAPVPPPQ